MLPTVEKTKNMKLLSQKCETTSVPEYSLYLIINAIQKESIKKGRLTRGIKENMGFV